MSIFETKIISEWITFDDILLVRACSGLLPGNADVPVFFTGTIDLEGAAAYLQKHKIEYISFHTM